MPGNRDLTAAAPHRPPSRTPYAPAGWSTGSIARGANRARSDLDLLVVGALPFGELIRLLQSAEARIGREIRPRLFSEKEYRRRLARRDRFLIAVLQGPKIVLVGDLDDAR